MDDSDYSTKNNISDSDYDEEENENDIFILIVTVVELLFVIYCKGTL